jgi:hypothetical protein
MGVMYVWSHTRCVTAEDATKSWICSACEKAGHVPYYVGQQVEKQRGGGRGKPQFFIVLAPPTEEEEKSFGTKGDVRELGNCSAM